MLFRNKKTPLLLLICIILASTLSGFTQTPSFSHVNYGVEDGLPCSEVYHMIQDSKGFYWFGTEVGVSRFNGYEFENFSLSDGLPDNNVFRLYEDKKGRIWFLTHNCQLSYFFEDSIYKYRYNHHFKPFIRDKRWISGLFVDPSDNLFFSINGENACGTISATGEFHYETQPNSEAPFTIYTYQENKQLKYTFFGKPEERSKLEIIGYPRKYQFVSQQSKGHFDVIMTKPNGGIYKYENMLFLTCEDTVFKLSEKVGLRDIEIDKNGQIWECSNYEGLCLYNSLEDYEANTPILQLWDGISASSILLKENGEVWITTLSNGVYRIFNRFVTNYNANEQTANKKITSVCVNTYGEIFYSAYENSIYKIGKDNRHQCLFDQLEGLSKLYMTNDNELIPVFYFNNPSIQKVTAYRTFLGRDIICSDSGELWGLKEGGVLKETKNNSSILVPLITGKDYFHCIYQDHKGKIWAGGTKGLYQWERAAFRLKNHWLPDKEAAKITAMLEIKPNLMALGIADKGLTFLSTLDSGKNALLTLTLPGVFIKDIKADAEDVIWLATNQGIYRIANTTENEINVQRITRNHGLPSNEINELALAGTMLYAATNKGLAIFNTAQLNLNIQEPTLYINEITINQHSVKSASTYNLPHDQNYLELAYIGISKNSFGNVKYRYFLEGVDPTWQYTTSRKVRYPALSPGNYNYKMSTAYEGSDWSAPLKIAIIIRSPYYQTIWFYITLSFVLSGFVFLFIRVKFRKLRIKREKEQQDEQQKRKMVEAELIALRMQMNPHFTFNTLNSIQNAIKKFDTDTALTYVNRFSKLMRRVLESSGNLFTPLREEIKTLELYIQLENMRFDNAIRWEINVAPKLDQDLYEIPTMIIQPFVENAILHGLRPKLAEKKRLKIDIHPYKKGIRCVIEDNGIGRVQSAEINRKRNKHKKSMGIAITKERLAFLYAESNLLLSTKDLYDENNCPIGTRVEINLMS